MVVVTHIKFGLRQNKCNFFALAIHQHVRIMPIEDCAWSTSQIYRSCSAVVNKFSLDSSKVNERALKLNKNLVSLLTLSGFEFIEVFSKGFSLATAINSDKCKSNMLTKEIYLFSEQLVNVLGLNWDQLISASVDNRCVHLPSNKAIAQSIILNFVCSFFHPIGLVAP